MKTMTAERMGQIHDYRALDAMVRISHDDLEDLAADADHPSVAQVYQEKRYEGLDYETD